MNCFFHVEQPAVAQCNICGRGLCKECAQKYSYIVCDDCIDEIETKIVAEELANKVKEKRRFVLAVILHLLVAVFLRLVVGEGGFLFGLVFGILFGGIPYGWKYVGKYAKFQGAFCIPIIGWFQYIVWVNILLIASYFFGWFFYLREIIKKIIGLFRKKKTEK